jgi:hypothetical protein
MVDHLSPFESNSDALLRRLDELEHRLRKLESRADAIPLLDADVAPSQPIGADRFRRARGVSASSVAALTGRTSLVLGGGYLLRALADFGVVPVPLAVALGEIYALAWFAMADRAGAARKNLSASFHALAASALVFPLCFEVSLKYRLLSPWTAAAAFTGVCALGFTVAWRRHLQAAVWIVSIASIATVLAFVRAGVDVAPFALHLVLLAAMAYWAAEVDQWWRVRWLAALAADGVVLWLVVQSDPPLSGVAATTAIAVALSLFAVSFADSAVRMLAFGRSVLSFDIFQACAAMVIGYGGAAYIAHVSGQPAVHFGFAGLALGAAVYGVSFRREAATLSRRNFYYFSTMAIALVVAGGSLAFQAPIAATLWIVLAPAGVWLGRRYSHATLSAHGSAYLVAAAVASGLLAQTTYGLLSQASWSWPGLTPAVVAALLAAAACSAVTPVGIRTLRATNVVMAIAGRRPSLGVPRAIALGVLVLGLAGVAVNWIVSRLPGSTGLDTHWGFIATIRTIMLAASAVLMALLARGDRIREAAWLIYPLLIAAGVKILIEDFRHSEPGTLFIALIVYGTALILAPRVASAS